MTAPVSPPPDDKDWTWVLDKVCDECGFDTASITGFDVPAIVRDAVTRWQPVLARQDASVRSAPQVWSELEYGCHTRDVFTMFAGRVARMLAADHPEFANWDQDATALAERYWEQQPAKVAQELAVAGEQVARTFESVSPDQWKRTGLRSNGDVFTVDSLGRYFVHDVVHHLADVHG
jgi:hypothetical protein